MNLDVVLANRKMKLKDLASQVGITIANLSVLKNGRARALRISTLDRICSVLACQPGDILEFKDNTVSYSLDSGFYRGIELLKGSLYSYVEPRDKFLIIRSHFTDEYYNYIVPLGSPREAEFDEIDKIRARELRSGWRMALYINEKCTGEFLQILRRKGYRHIATDVYMIRALSDLDNLSESSLTLVTDDNAKEYRALSISCFPGWANQEAYTDYFLVQKDTDDGICYRTYMLLVDGRVVSFGSCVYSSRIGLGYLHNIGTVEKFRRQGYFSVLTDSIMKILRGSGVREVFTVVEKSGLSYFAFKKLGFHTTDVFSVYYK